jgi:N-acetylneuraminate synthase
MMPEKTITVNGRSIGGDNPVFTIAEIGINHNGDMSIAKRLIDAVHACKWDVVKFQKRTPNLCVPETQKNVIKDTPWGKMTYLEYKNKIEFGKKEYKYIDKYCREKPISWTASVWDIPSLHFMMNYDVPFIKIPSAKLTDLTLIAKAALFKKPVFLSVGMSTFREIDRAVTVLEKKSVQFVLMHTNSVYPTPIEELNIKCIETLRKRYRCIVGYSGHEYDLEATVFAVALGAKVIESHITLDHKMWGTHQSASLEVMGMDILGKRIKDINIILGDGIKRITKGEVIKKNQLRDK